MNITRITSRTNQLIVDTAKLKDKKHRDEISLFVFEGIKLFEEAVASGLILKNIFVSEESSLSVNAADKSGLDYYLVSRTVYEKLSADRSPDGILCTCEYITALHTPVPSLSGRAIILCDIQDPGNLGTCIRSARAFGIDEIILAGNCADIYNRRCIRAAMGALFRQRITRIEDPIKAIEYCRNAGKKVFSAALRSEALNLYNIEITEETVFAVGNEGHGLSDEFITAGDGCVIIPMKGDTESLNAAVASSIIMWETARR